MRLGVVGYMRGHSQGSRMYNDLTPPDERNLSGGGGQRGDIYPRLYQEMDRSDARWDKPGEGEGTGESGRKEGKGKGGEEIKSDGGMSRSRYKARRLRKGKGRGQGRGREARQGQARRTKRRGQEANQPTNGRRIIFFLFLFIYLFLYYIYQSLLSIPADSRQSS